MSLLGPTAPPIAFRGTTVLFSTIFYDANGNIVNPLGAVINIVYVAADGVSEATTQVTMVSPMDGMTWTAQWDSRGAGPGPVWCSVHTTAPASPYSVEDFYFTLNANNANLLTF
jgi:hypothetical protein